MKFLRIRVLLSVLAAFITISINHAHSAEFTADLFQKLSGQTIKSKYYIKGDIVRMETSPEAINIINIKKGTFFMVHPKQMMYMTMPNIPYMSKEAIQHQKDTSDIAEKKLIGKEKINGYICEKYEITYKNNTNSPIIQWYSKKLDHPVKIISHGPHGEVISEYKNIKEGGINDSIFEIPSNYRMMKMPMNGRHIMH